MKVQNLIYGKSGGRVFMFILLSALLAGCGQEAKPLKTDQNEPVPVRVSGAALKDISENIEYVGNIKAQDETVVYPKVSGKIIRKIKEAGAPVEKGAAIAYIDRDEVGLKFENAPVESPITGIVGSVYVDIGTNVTPQTPVALVVNMDMVKIFLDVPERYLPRIFLGQEAKISVDAYPGEEFTGRVVKISPVVDLATRTAPIEISVDNEQHKLNSGMFARVRLTINEKKNALVIMKEAVIGKADDIYVFVIENNKASLKKVALGIAQSSHVEVVEGLKEGDMVVVMGKQRLKDGSDVTVEKE